MGLNGAHSYTHSVSKVSIGELYQIAISRKKDSIESNPANVNNPLIPTLDVDASWIYRSTGIKLENRLQWMINFMLEFVKVGFKVVIVCDGAVRHHSKRASTERISKYKKTLIEGYVRRATLMKLAETRNECTNIEEKENIAKREHELSKKIINSQKIEQSTNVDVGDEFFYNLKDAIEKLTLKDKGNRNGDMVVIKSQYQADTVLAYRCMHSISNVVLASDSDLAALVGNKCVAIKSFKYIENNKNVDKLSLMVLYTPSIDTLKDVANYICVPLDSDRIIISDFAFFDCIEDIKIRGLLAVGLGCDVFLSGVKQIGRVTLKKYIENEVDFSFDNIMSFYYETANKQKRRTKKSIETEVNNNINNEYDNINNKELFYDALQIFVDSFIYEPANYYNDEIIPEIPKYITKHKPEKLHEYNKEFANEDLSIEIFTSNNTLLECICCSTYRHIFLSFEGNFNCKLCNNVLCKYCINKDNENIYCHDCYLTEIAAVPKSIINQPPISIMREQLLEAGLDTNLDDNSGDISDLYDAIIEKKHFDILTNKDNIMKNISIPLYSSNYLNTENILFRFQFKDGGSFIRHPKFTLHSKLDIVFLLGRLVQTGSSKHFHKSNEQVSTVLPDLIVSFAERARLRSGYRLLKRALRHAMDPNGPNIMASKCCIIEHHNGFGIHICHEIKASMKKDIYLVRVSFNATEILAVSCTCKAGCCNEEKIVCVHILPVILQVSILLFDGLSEHLLCELANDLSKDVEKDLTDEQVSNLKESIILLKRSNSEVNDIELSNNLSINDLLHKYKVGTENFKKGPGHVSDTDVLGPLRSLSFNSPQIMLKNIINKKHIKEISNIDKNIASNSNEVDNVPYNMIYNLNLFVMQYFRHDPKSNSTLYDCVGYKLLKLRSDDQEPVCKKEMNKKIKQLLDAINKANDEYREFDYLSVEKNNNNNENHFAVIQSYNGEQYIETNESNKLENENHVLNNIDNNIIPTKKNGLTCCMNECTNTSSNMPGLRFVRVPPIPRKIKPNQTITNNKLNTYSKKMFIRKEWLKRLELQSNNKNNNLRICNTHPLEYQEVEYTWKNIENEQQINKSIIRLPCNKNDPPLRTRQQYTKRKPVNNTEYVPNKKANKNDNNIFSNTDNMNTIINSDIVYTSNNSTNNTATNVCDHNNISNKSKIKRAHRFCCYAGCRIFDSIENLYVKFYSIPKMPKPINDKANNRQRQHYAERLEFQKQYYKIIGIKLKDSRKDLRICNQHKEQNVKSLVTWYDKNNKRQSSKIIMNLPAVASDDINKSITNKENKGLGIDRLICKTINTAISNSNIPGNENMSWALTVQQTLAMNDGPENVHPSVARAVGIDVHENRHHEYKIIRKEKEREKVVIRLNALSNKEIKSRTGFETIVALICHTLILCNGDIDLMVKKKSKLTWYEEWFMYYERLYSRSISRWEDYERLYKRSGPVLRDVFDSKLQIAIECRLRWPRYCRLREDEQLRQSHWNDTYGGTRVVMWDNTAINLPKPQDSEAQRNTWSTYYAGNVGKGAIFIQLCGWLGTHELWMGAVSDSDYFTRSGILQQQQDFLPLYDNVNEHIPWINILDKGYRVTGAAWRSGHQFVLQPSFAKSDQKFSSVETIRSATIAADRGANERAVRLSKMSFQLTEGRTGNKSIERLSDIWLIWAFQCNFIYKPVL